MANVLVLTTDLPFFPGKMGIDFFNLRYLARQNHVGIVAPRYDSYPTQGVQNLAKSVQQLFLWPDPAAPLQLFVSERVTGSLPSLMRLLPAWLRRRILFKQIGITGQPDDAYERLAILANCAPHLLHALQQRHWTGIVLIQSSLAPWLEFLPDVGAKVLYFHDVRSDYLRRSVEQGDSRIARRVQLQEQQACNGAEAVGFVSSLDLGRAEKLLRLPVVREIAPIPVDTDYFVPRPADWSKDPRQIVLFTGHLRHPPNVDAVVYFLEEIWPLVRNEAPQAIFQAVGMTPHPRIEAAMATAKNAELHANVPDIRPYFWNANVYVVPMRYGGGVRQKIFEAWAMRVPVVSTTMGVEGTGAKDGDNCRLADGPAALAEKLVEILRAKSELTLVTEAQALVNRTNSIPAAAGSFENLVKRGIGQRRSRPFKLLYDLRWMEIGKAGGIEQMAHELVHSVSQLDHANEYRIHIPPSTYHDWKLDSGFRCRPHFSDRTTAKLEAYGSLRNNRLAESLNLPRVFTPEMRTLREWRRMDFDLVHSLVGYIYPDLQAFPHVVTIHDLQHRTFRQFFEPHEWKTRENLYRESAKRAVHVIAISEFTRQDIHRSYGIPLEKITTIWNIPSRNIWIPIAEQKSRELLRKIAVTDPFLFFPAHCWPHKNHVRLLEAFALAVPHIDPNIQLVLTGQPFPADHPARAAIERCGLQKRVIHLGYRSPLEMKALFHSCLLLVFPSLFEGFGMPVAEAIIAGKPVACSRTTCLPEIAGDAALTFDPENIHDIAGRLLEIINDPARREALATAARRRRPLFSARLCAIKTISLYRRVHEALYQA